RHHPGSRRRGASNGAARPLPEGRRVSILNSPGARQGPARSDIRHANHQTRGHWAMSAAAAAGPANSVDSSIDAAEIAKFAAFAESWWDPDGQSRPLHRLNPTRLAYIRDRTAAHLGRDPLSPRPMAGLRAADIGCGGGLLSEPLARLGAQVTGVDAGEQTIAVARAHAAESGLPIDYRLGTAEALAGAGERFDLVLALEIVEHVA